MVKNGGITNAQILDDGTASFAGGLVSAGTYAGYGTMRLFDSSFSIRDAGGSNIKIDLIPDGTSSFLGAMQVDNDVTVDGSFLVKNGGTTKARILDDGTASFEGGLTINGSVNIYDDLKVYNGSNIKFDVDSGTGNGSFAGNLKCDGTATLDDVITSGTGSFGTLNCGGEITAAGDITAFSDRRLKNDIKPIESALEKVKKLSGYTYTKDDRRSTGVIAQEVLEVLPEAVHGSEETMYSVAYGNMVGLLIEAIKELSER